MTSSTPQGHIEDVLRRFDVQSFLLLAVSVPQDAVDSTSKPKETLDGKNLAKPMASMMIWMVEKKHTVQTAFS